MINLNNLCPVSNGGVFLLLGQGYKKLGHHTRPMRGRIRLSVALRCASGQHDENRLQMLFAVCGV